MTEEGMPSVGVSGAIVLDERGLVLAATRELLLTCKRPLSEIFGTSPTEAWPNLSEMLPTLAGLRLPGGTRLLVATPASTAADVEAGGLRALAAWRAVEQSLVLADPLGDVRISERCALAVEVLRPLAALLAPMAREAVSAEIRRRASPVEARSLMEAALTSVSSLLPSLVKIQRNYQPARLLGVDTVLIEEALTLVPRAVAADMDAGATASPTFNPTLQLATDSDGGVRLLVSHNSSLGAASASSVLALAEPPVPATTLAQARRIVRACGGEIHAGRRPEGGAHFVLRFPK